MLNKLVSNIISKIKNEPYKLDPNINTTDIIIILCTKTLQVVRGSFKKLFFKKSHGIVFAGKNVKISHANHLTTGGGLTIGDNCRIDALCSGGVNIGNNVSIGRGSIIECTGVIRSLGSSLNIGNRVGFAQNCFIEVRGPISIGDDCIFASGVTVVSENHNFSDRSVPIRLQGETRKGISIGSNCWIGTKVIILDGVTIGQGCVIGAGAVVTKDIPDYSVAVGVPAKVIKIR